METNEYVHGYSDRERGRLRDQATTLTDVLHGDTVYPAGSLVLEAGCGVGAQTITLAENAPVRRSFPSTSRRTRSQARSEGRPRAWRTSRSGCRHLPPALRRRALRPRVRVLCPGAPGAPRDRRCARSAEGRWHDHGHRRRSRVRLLSPGQRRARRAIQCLIDLQRSAGGMR